MLMYSHIRLITRTREEEPARLYSSMIEAEAG